MTTKKALTVVSLLACLLLLTFVIPASWVGVKEYHRPALLLTDPTQLASLSGDEDRNSNPDWRDLLLETTSSSTRQAASQMVVSEEEKARLADPNNLTASFSKNLYTAAAYAEKNGGLTKETQSQIVTELIDKEASKITIKTYAVTDLHIAANTQAAIHAYGNDLGKILEKANKYNLGQNDIAIINAYAVNKDPSPLASFVVKKNNVARIIVDLLAVQVPFSAVPYHLLLINQLSVYETTLDNMSKAQEDPVRAALAFNDYLNVYKILVTALGSLQDYLALKNVTYAQSEPGYTFINGYTTVK